MLNGQNALRPSRHRARLAAVLGRARDVPHRAPPRPPQVLRARHVPVPVGKRSPRGASGRATSRRTSPPVTGACAATTCSHPMGWDAFGLPAEQHAINTGTPPARSPRRRTSTRSENSSKCSGSPTTGRERSNTTNPGYLKWTQWIFLQLFQARARVSGRNSGQLVPGARDGARQRRSHRRRAASAGITRSFGNRCGNGSSASRPTPIGSPSELEGLDWPESKQKQIDWIGRSEGAEVDFPLDRSSRGADRLHDASRHAVRRDVHGHRARPSRSRCRSPTAEHRAEIEAYAAAAARKSDMERTALNKEKTGVFTGAYATNPLNGAKIPIYTADYVLGAYGTGAIMAVPGHDERDFEFAEAFGLPVVEVVSRRRHAHTTGWMRRFPATASPFDRETSTAFRRAEARRKSWRDWSARKNRPREGELQAARLDRSAVSATGASRSRSISPSQPPATRAKAQSTRSTTRAHRVRRERATAAASRARRLSPGRPAGPAHARTRLALLSEATASGTRGRRTRCRSGLARVGTTCGTSTRQRPSRVQRASIRRLDARRSLRRRCRAHGAAPALRALLAQGALRRRRREARRAVHEARSPGHDARAGVSLVRRCRGRRLGAHARSTATTRPSNTTARPAKHFISGAHEPVEERWLSPTEVRWDGPTPRHPVHGVKLVSVAEKMSKSRGNVVNPD